VFHLLHNFNNAYIYSYTYSTDKGFSVHFKKICYNRVAVRVPFTNSHLLTSLPFMHHVESIILTYLGSSVKSSILLKNSSCHLVLYVKSSKLSGWNIIFSSYYSLYLQVKSMWPCPLPANNGHPNSLVQPI
jgi:hypothetical protein